MLSVHIKTALSTGISPCDLYVCVYVCVYKIYLGASHSYLRPSIDVNSAVCFSGNRAAHCVGYTDCQSPALLAIAQCHQGVCCLTWGEEGMNRSAYDAELQHNESTVGGKKKHTREDVVVVRCHNGGAEPGV